MSGRVAPVGSATCFKRQASSAKLLNALLRVSSTSARCSATFAGVDRCSGSVHSNGSSQRFEVIPPKVCSIAAAHRNTFSPTECKELMLVSAGTAYKISRAVLSISAHELKCKRANSRSRLSTISRLPSVCAFTLSFIRGLKQELRTEPYRCFERRSVSSNTVPNVRPPKWKPL